jgi:hypothetical protein
VVLGLVVLPEVELPEVLTPVQYAVLQSAFDVGMHGGFTPLIVAEHTQVVTPFVTVTWHPLTPLMVGQ